MKNVGPALKVGFTLLLAFGLGYWAFTLLAKGGMGANKDALRVHCYFSDATGIVEKSLVQVAGLNVGHIVSKELVVNPPRAALVKQKRFAKIVIGLQAKVILYENATVQKKSTSLLGGFYLEVDPGTRMVRDHGKLRRARVLKDGAEIPRVVEAVTIEQVVAQIHDTMPVLRAISVEIRDLAKGPMRSISENIDEGIKENRASIKSLLDNINAITRSVRRISTGAESDVRVILADIRQTTGMIRQIVGRSDGDVKATAEKVKSGLDKLVGSINKLDTAMTDVDAITSNVKDVTAGLKEGKGTIGRLLRDDKLVNDVEDVVSDAGGFVRSLTGLQTVVGLRSEYNFQAGTIKTYLSVEIRPRPDKFYLVELVDDPRGSRGVSTIITRTDDPSRPQFTREEKVTINDAFRFSFMFAKRISLFTVRFGIKENTGGTGFDLHLWDDRITLTADLFDFSANVWPRLKAAASWEFFRRIYVVGGIDDAFNDRPIDGSAGGRDYFLGLQIRFTDEDLKTLLMFGGSALGSVSKK